MIMTTLTVRVQKLINNTPILKKLIAKNILTQYQEDLHPIPSSR